VKELWLEGILTIEAANAWREPRKVTINLTLHYVRDHPIEGTFRGFPMTQYDVRRRRKMGSINLHQQVLSRASAKPNKAIHGSGVVAIEKKH
jgi:hypothetical protein